MKASFLLLTILGVIAVKLVTGKIDRVPVSNVVSNKQQPAIAGEIANRRRVPVGGGSCSHCVDGHQCKPWSSSQPENCVTHDEQFYCSSSSDTICKTRRRIGPRTGGGTSQGHSCMWRQTGLCRWDGPRERHNDKSCDEEITWWRPSGYCQCADGNKRMKTNCGHTSFSTCRAACKGTTFFLAKNSSIVEWAPWGNGAY